MFIGHYLHARGRTDFVEAFGDKQRLLVIKSFRTRDGGEDSLTPTDGNNYIKIADHSEQTLVSLMVTHSRHVFHQSCEQLCEVKSVCCSPEAAGNRNADFANPLPGVRWSTGGLISWSLLCRLVRNR